MTPAAYRSTLTTLGLTPDQAGEWLGIGRSTAWRYLKEGAPGPVARALGVAVGVVTADRWEVYSDRDGDAQVDYDKNGDWVSHSDLTAALDLPGKGTGE